MKIMKKLATNTIVVLIVLLNIYSCSNSNDSNTNPIDTDEFYVDSTGKYILELGDEGYNIYSDGKAWESSSLTNKVAKTTKTSGDIRKVYQYNYHGICILPPQWPRSNNNPLLSSLPNKQTLPGKKTITANFKTLGGGYRVTPKPAFLGGSNYACYECLVESIDRNDFYLGVCNGSVFISGGLSDDPSFQSLKATLLGLKFNPNESEQFVQALNSSGVYKCTKR
jgi:hypothetical protein